MIPTVSNPHNGLRSSFKPSSLKSLEALQSGHKQARSGHPENQSSHTYHPTNQHAKPESHPSDRVYHPHKVHEAKSPAIEKKYSVQLEPGSIPPPKKENFHNIQTAPGHHAKSGSAMLGRQELRTTITASNFSQRPVMDRQALRKTTNAPMRIFTEPDQQTNGQSVPAFKKQQIEKREMPDFTTINKQVRSPVTMKRRAITISDFKLGMSLGTGKFGEVYLAKHISTGFICAIKKLDKAKAREMGMVNQLVQQIKLHAFVSHPNIAQFYGCVADEHSVYILLEYMEGGTLFDFMNRDPQHPLSEPEIILFVRSVTSAVKYLHDSNIAHRDIKPENIVLSYGVAKLCDFGWSARVQGSRKTYCGTFDYAPPEILEHKEYDVSVDLWCLGVLTYELVTGRVPFEHQERKVVRHKIVNVDKDQIDYPETMSAMARDFIQSLVKKNPAERTKSYKLLSHPFLDRPETKLKHDN